MLDLFFLNPDFDDERQIEMSQILLQFLESNQHMFSPKILKAMKRLRREIEAYEKKSNMRSLANSL